MRSENDRWAMDRAQLLRRGAAGAMGLSALGLLACGDDDDDGAPGTTAATDTRPSAPTGTFRMGFVSLETAADWDPHLGSSGGNISVTRHWNVYDSLVHFFNGEIEMVLATEITSDDAMTWNITLRDDVKFHNGKLMTAEDVVFSMKRYADPKSFGAGTWGQATPRATGPTTVEVKLKSPDATFINTYCTTLSVVPVDYDPKNAIGTGPFKAGAIDVAKQTMTANLDYWRDGPYIETVELYGFKDESARVNALLAGQIDGLDNVPLAQMQTLENDARFAVNVTQGSRFTPFVMHAGTAPFDDVRVRQAMRLIVNRKDMNERVQRGLGVLANDLPTPFDPAYLDPPQREQDIEQAKSLLSAAGQSDLRLELNTAPITLGAVEQSQILVEQAKAAGVTIRLKQLDPAVYFTPEGGYGTYPFSVSIGGGTGETYLGYCSSIYGPQAFYNETQWEDDEWTRLRAEAIKTVDPEARGELARQMQQIEYDTGPYIIWAYSPVTAVYVKGLKGVEKLQTVVAFNDLQLRTLWLA